MRKTKVYIGVNLKRGVWKSRILGVMDGQEKTATEGLVSRLRDYEDKGREIATEPFDEKGYHFIDWRQFVDDDLIAAWKELTDRERGIIFEITEQCASLADAAYQDGMDY